eukprot:jgi/Botrbrau1/5841/Bobra.0366s0022.1
MNYLVQQLRLQTFAAFCCALQGPLFLCCALYSWHDLVLNTRIRLLFLPVHTPTYLMLCYVSSVMKYGGGGVFSTPKGTDSKGFWT